MKLVLGALLVVWAVTGIVRGAPVANPVPFHGTVYQVDTVFNNIDVIMPDRKRTLWAGASTRVRVHDRSAQLIDIAMGDEVSGTYVAGPKGALILVKIEDLK